MLLTPEVGERIGRWTVLGLTRTEPTASVPYGRRAVLCRCDCGTESVVTISNLRHGISNSCGCLHREIVVEHNRRHKPAQITKHGLYAHMLYPTWWAMVQRCTNPLHVSYRYYGAKGVSVCEQWMDVAVFIADIERLLGPRPLRYTLDRIDPYGNYEPSNVRWATWVGQRANRRAPVR